MSMLQVCLFTERNWQSALTQIQKQLPVDKVVTTDLFYTDLNYKSILVYKQSETI